jgi:ATP-dependent exoDNAse (exonuclease V) beta subunit
MARPYNVSGLLALVRHLQSEWEAHSPRPEGEDRRLERSCGIVTIHSSKGLEWPVVIPINMSAEFPTPPQFIHRRSDDTLHSEQSPSERGGAALGMVGRHRGSKRSEAAFP